MKITGSLPVKSVIIATKNPIIINFLNLKTILKEFDLGEVIMEMNRKNKKWKDKPGVTFYV